MSVITDWEEYNLSDELSMYVTTAYFYVENRRLVSRLILDPYSASIFPYYLLGQESAEIVLPKGFRYTGRMHFAQVDKNTVEITADLAPDDEYPGTPEFPANFNPLSATITVSGRLQLVDGSDINLGKLQVQENDLSRVRVIKVDGLYKFVLVAEPYYGEIRISY